MDWSRFNADFFWDIFVTYGSRISLAVATLLVGLWLTGWLSQRMDDHMKRLDVEVTLRRFLKSVTSLVLKILVLITVASMLGVATTSFIAVLGAAGLAIGLALRDSLSNFAGGVLMIIFKPYKVGDFVEMQGQSGTVQAIQILNTVLLTADNKTVFIPNGPIINGNVTNHTNEHKRRVEVNLGIGYGSDIDVARKTLLAIVNADQRILSEPAPDVVVAELGESAVVLRVRAWVSTPDYWSVFFAIQEEAKKSFDVAGVEIPFPQRTVHVVQKVGG
ncbi:MAG: mechanosensitive ion channel family protein [Hydrogenophaga sp.]|jgi:small conductance mechanosensitive channel